MTGPYRYKAMDARGRTVRGVIGAANEAELDARLAQAGLDLISFKRAARRPLGCVRARVPRHEIINFTFHLQQLVSAGVPIVDGLRDLRESITHPGLRAVAADTLTAIDGGRRLSEALAAFPEAFDTVYVSMIRVGEESGRLDTILSDLTRMLRWQDELIALARRAMLYPAFVGAIVLPAMVALMVLLVPQLTRLLELTGGRMPLHTRALLVTSDFLVAHWPALLAAPPALGAALAGLAAASPACRRLRDTLTLRLWVLGPVLHRIKLARFANYFALMYAAGITVLEAIALSRSIVGNAALDAALARVRERIADGGGISRSFAQSGLFPPLVVRMLQVGEQSGALDEALLNVSYFYDRQAKETVERVATLLGPVLVLIIAVLLGWIMTAVVPPIYAAVFSLDF